MTQWAELYLGRDNQQYRGLGLHGLCLAVSAMMKMMVIIMNYLQAQYEEHQERGRYDQHYNWLRQLQQKQAASRHAGLSIALWCNALEVGLNIREVVDLTLGWVAIK